MSFVNQSALEQSLEALEKDLLRPGGPHISTVSNYNFAILPYPPEDEFALRRAIHRLSEKLQEAGWNLEELALHSMMLDRIQAQGQEVVDSLVAREKNLAKNGNNSRAITMLKERIVTLLEGPDGLAKDVIDEIDRIWREAGPNANRTAIFIGRAGALYPFFRTSALLKYIAGRTHNMPVVLLYPGKVVGETALSFMGELASSDRDYRPRIYR